MRRPWGTAVVAVLAASLAACGNDTAPAADDGRLNVVTTVAPLTSIAATVGGDRVAVTGLVPEGTNSHTFEPPPSAAEVLSKADLIVVNGLKLEDPTLELADSNKKQGAAIVSLGDKVLDRKDWIFDFSFPEKDGKPNPHLWTDPNYAVRYAEVLHAEFLARDPEGKATFDAGLAVFRESAGALAAAMVDASRTVARRELLTYHDGYAYFARDFGWTVLGAIQPSSFEEPSPREVAALIEQIRTRRVPAIFGSEVFPSGVLQQIGNATGARYVDTLRDDDLPGKPGDPEHSWLGLMRQNFVTMVEALGGDATAVKAVPLPTTQDTARYPQ